VQVTGKVRTDDKGTNQVDIVIEGFGAASLHDRSGREDYALLEQRDNPVLAARRTLRDPLVAHYHLRLGPETVALRAFQRMVYDQNGNDTPSSCSCP